MTTKELGVATTEYEPSVHPIAIRRHYPAKSIDPNELFKSYPDYEKRGGSEYVVNNLGPQTLYETDPEDSRERYAASNLAVDLVVHTHEKPDIIYVATSHLPNDKRRQRVAVDIRNRLAKLDLADERATPENSHTFSAACSSSIFALHKLGLLNPQGANILMVVDEMGYRRTLLPPEQDDQKSALLMSDFAVALQFTYGEDFEVLASEIHFLGDKENLLAMRVPLYNADPFIHINPPPYADHFLMQGAKLRRFFNKEITRQKLEALMSMADVKPEQLDFFLSHQASIGMVRDAHKLFPEIPYKPQEGIVTYGNTSSASTLLDLEDGLQDGKIQEGDTGLMLGFGGGLGWGAAVVRVGQKQDFDPLLFVP